KQPISLSVKTTDSICAGSSVQLAAYGAEIYNWQPATGLNNNTIQNPLASPTTTTTYTLIGTDNKNCFSDTTMVKVEVFPIPQFNIIDTAITINLGAKDTIETTSSPDITTWGWTPSLGLSCNNCPQPVAQPPSTITYTANVVNAGGCTASDQITIKVLCNGSNVFVPNTFSPNNDGMNDVFYPRGVGPVRVRGFRIFNRWGALLFERNNFDLNDPSTGWKGDYKGKPVDAGVYVYVLELICDNQTIFPMKGNVTLLK
ncbi:MAG: gliding motility-associated C-terminal domain-containing protein, partial [Ilyomonas sp.]